MSALLRVLAGARGGWILGGLALALLAAGSAGGWAARGLMDAPVIAAEKMKTAQCVAGRDAARADAAQATVAALNASVVQVRQPVYRDSIGVAGHFMKHLGPLNDALRG